MQSCIFSTVSVNNKPFISITVINTIIITWRGAQETSVRQPTYALQNGSEQGLTAHQTHCRSYYYPPLAYESMNTRPGKSLVPRGLSSHPIEGSTPLLKNSTPLTSTINSPSGVVCHEIRALSESLRTVT